MNTSTKAPIFKNPSTAPTPQNQPQLAHGSLDASEIQVLTALAKKQATAALEKIPLLGAVAWLMLQQSSTRNSLLADLEWRVMPALVLGQAKLYMREQAPLAYVSWAKLSEDVAQRYRQAPHHLAAGDWKCGEQIWLVDILAPFGGAQELLADVRQNVFPGQALYQLAPSESGDANIQCWQADQKQA